MLDGTTNVMTPAQMIEAFVTLRDRIAAIKEAHKKQLEPYNEMRARLEGALLAELDKVGVSSMRAEAGTAYKETATSVKVDEWIDTLGFIRQHQLWDLLEARVSKTAALAVIEETKAPIPGVKVSQVMTVHVRRS